MTNRFNIFDTRDQWIDILDILKIGDLRVCIGNKQKKPYPKFLNENKTHDFFYYVSKKYIDIVII